MAAGMHHRRQLVKRALGIRQVMKNPYGHHEIKNPCLEWEPLCVGLYRQNRRWEVAPGNIDGAADVDGNYASTKLGGVKGVPTGTRAYIENQFAGKALRGMGAHVIRKILAPLLAQGSETIPLIGEGVCRALLDITGAFRLRAHRLV